MADRVRFHLDENVDTDVARGLRRYGIDVTTTQESGMRELRDTAHWSFIKSEGRVIVTHDVDFLRLANSSLDHPGVVYASKAGHSVGDIIRALILIYEVLSPSEMAGRVEFL